MARCTTETVPRRTGHKEALILHLGWDRQARENEEPEARAAEISLPERYGEQALS